MMKRDLLKTTILTAVLVDWMAGLPGIAPAAGTPAVKMKVELLFVQNAKGVAIDRDKGTNHVDERGPAAMTKPINSMMHENKRG